MNCSRNHFFPIVLTLLLLLSPAPANAQDRTSYSLTDENIPVVRMERSYGGTGFQTSNAAVSISSFVGATPEEEAEVMKQINEHVQNLPKQLESFITLPELPECKQNVEVALPVYSYTRGTEYFDYVFYNPKNRDHVVAAERWGYRAVPYSAGTSYGARTKKEDPRPLLALSLGVRCLPARIHFTFEDKQRVISYREGSKAWLESEQDEQVNDFRQ
ncbi:MAG: hypothetical protein KDD66_17430 [Bdellovibrionales bacterium]|nr:hypothetical protein [Bdellovibrionales bacterium]